MSITSAGMKCDVCGNFIFFGYEEFSVKGIDGMLHCEGECKKILEEIDGDWSKLPAGPLKEAFQKATAKAEGSK